MHQHDSATHDLARNRLELTESLARRDAVSAASAYTADARLLPPLVDVVEGRDQIRAFWQAGVDSGIAGVEFEPIDCIALDAVAYELGRYSISTTADTGRVVERGRYITIHRLIDGRWLRAVEMLASDNQPAGDRS